MVQQGYTLRNRYRIIRTVGRGGMADVYLAFDERRQVHVAVKVLREDLAEDPEFIRRFQREALALAQLDHPNIVRFYSFEREGVIAFMVLDYVAGVTLRRYMTERGGPLALGEVTWILRSVGAALHYAHSEGIVHRDVKPGNIMLREDGQVLVSDFGIAKVMASATVTTFAVGTPAYMSPEQILGREITPASDIYSLGVVLYQMVTGRRPFTGEEAGLTGSGTLARLREAHLRLMPVDPRRYNKGLPEGAAGVVLRALAKAPGERWPDVASMVRAWEEVIREAGIQPTPPRVRSVHGGASETTQLLTSTPAEQLRVATGEVSGNTSVIEKAPDLSRQRPRNFLMGALVITNILLIIVGLMAFVMLRGHSATTLPTLTNALSPGATIEMSVRNPSSSPSVGQTPHTVKPGSMSSMSREVGTVVPPTFTPTSTPPPTPWSYALVKSSPIYLRTGSSTDAKEVDLLPVGTQMVVLSLPQKGTDKACRQGLWRKVRVISGRAEGKEGWVCEEDIVIGSTGTAEASVLPAPILVAPAKEARVTDPVTFEWRWEGPSLKEHQAFDVRAWRAGGVPKGIKDVRAIGHQTSIQVDLRNLMRPGYYYWTVVVVEYTDEYSAEGPKDISPTAEPIGFTYLGLPTLTPTPTSSYTPTPTPSMPFARVSVHMANLRAGPGTVYDIIGHYPEGTEVQLEGHYKDWYYVVTPDGKRGWMAGVVLSLPHNLHDLPLLTPPPTPTPRPTLPPQPSEGPPSPPSAREPTSPPKRPQKPTLLPPTLPPLRLTPLPPTPPPVHEK